MVNPQGETKDKRWLHGEKTFWWSESFSLMRELEPDITVTAEHLDGSAPKVEAEPGTNGSHPDLGDFMLVGLELPQPGCWKLTAQYKEATLSYVVWVSGGEVAAESTAPLNTNGRITSEMILEDGVVTEEEYRAGALAVVACLTDAGFEAGVDFDDPSGNPTSLEGHAGFAVDHADNATESANEAFNRCQDLHLSDNVSLGWAALLGQINLEELREETATLVACVEGRTGVDFGELTYDKFGFLTDQGEQTRDAAFEYRVHSFWGECRAEIGLLLWPDPDSFRMHEDLEPTDSGFLEIVERDGLTLMIRGPLDNVCLDVTDETGMAGGCGADLAEPMNFGVGGLRGKSFIYGWAPTNAAKVVFTLADATEIEVTDLVTIEGFDVQFFLELIPSNETGEADLPIKVVAVDANGEEIAGFVLGDGNNP